MAKDNQILHSTQEPQEQEHLQGGQESTDMAAFRERMHDDLMTYKLISAIGNLCQFVGFLNDSIGDLIEETKKFDSVMTENVRISARSTRHIMDDMHDVVKGHERVHVDTEGCYNALSDIVDALHDHDGDSIGESIGAIRTDFGCACDPDADTQMKVRIDGDIMNHPY